MPSERPRQGPTPHSRAFDSSEFSHQRRSRSSNKTSCGRFAHPAICFREERRGNDIRISLRNRCWIEFPAPEELSRRIRVDVAGWRARGESTDAYRSNISRYGRDRADRGGSRAPCRGVWAGGRGCTIGSTGPARANA
jgi:hypothetical protein